MNNPDTTPLFNMVCAALGVYMAGLLIPSIINLKNKKLGTVPTVIQIIFLILMAYGIPVAIWGIVLLVKSHKNANKRVDFTVKTRDSKNKVLRTESQPISFAGACSTRPEELKFELKEGRRI